MVDRIGEFVDGQIRTLPRTVDGEEAQAHDPHFVEVRVVSTDVFASDLGRRVGAQRLRKGQVFVERNNLRKSINRGAGRKHKPAHALFPRRFQQVVRARDVGVDVKLGILQRGSHPGACGKMDDGVKTPVRQNPPHKIAVPYIALLKHYSAAKRGDVGPLDGRIVEIVEIIDHRHFAAFMQEPAAHMRANESGPAGHQEFHPANLGSACFQRQAHSL